MLIQHFGLHGELQLPLRYNIAPTQQVAVVRQTGSGRELSTMRWGLVPSWADDPKIGYRMINARSEDAATKPSFRAAMK
jgi:putative SOS response-associated peptidase YedK